MGKEGIDPGTTRYGATETRLQVPRVTRWLMRPQQMPSGPTTAREPLPSQQREGAGRADVEALPQYGLTVADRPSIGRSREPFGFSDSGQSAST